MVEKVFKLTQGDKGVVEKLLFDENINYVHLILVADEGFPEHFSNSNVYMTILRGTISLNLANQGIHEYEGGTMVAIPNNTKMHIQNLHKEPLEVIIVKAPAPKEG